jgi:putative nucleotidyltransferase with HDIG domain
VNGWGQLTRGGRAYIGCVILCGGAAISYGCVDLVRHPLDWHWFILAGLTLLSGSITVKLPSIPATISVSETFVFTAVMLFGPSAGTITVALDALIISLWLQRKKLEAYKALFNVAAPSVSLWLSAQLYYLLLGFGPLSAAPDVQVPVLHFVFPLIAFTLAYFLLNSSLIAVAISHEKGTPAIKVWKENFVWLSLNFFSGASTAALLVAYTRRLDPIAVGIIIPVLIISYLSYKTSIGRLADTTRHLSELNLLYLSTIETLAMWIDAKDQITHGHIRRVQVQAVALARELGVRDEKLIKAIEAAALLHDMGKLAVPEHILNKPGKLTPGEFEKMKLHASVGAQILSAIDFPYPVVPIVRHHHENWDGSGYPDCLGGTDIPIGARILAVVDCFDALTSDRPYRPRLQDREALRILALRRGSMYDPLVVDAFFRVQASMETQPPTVDSQHRAMASDVLSQVRGTSESGSVFVSEAPLSPIEASIDLRTGTGRRLLQSALHGVPVSLAVLFAHDSHTDTLVSVHAVGDGSDRAVGRGIRIGQGVSGWVAANRRAMANSDPSLDFGDGFQSDGAALRSCMSLPVLLGDSLLGVITLYSTETDRFSADNMELLDSLVRQFVGDFGARLQPLEDQQPSDELVESLGLDLALIHGQLHGQRVGVIALTLAPDCSMTEEAAEQLDRAVDRLARENLRKSDLTIRTGRREILVVLPHTDSGTATATAERLARTLRETRFSLSTSKTVGVVPSYGVAMSPDQGTSIHSLVSAARRSAADLAGSALHTARVVH